MFSKIPIFIFLVITHPNELECMFDDFKDNFSLMDYNLSLFGRSIETTYETVTEFQI
jgi:hypothetical protein